MGTAKNPELSSKTASVKLSVRPATLSTKKTATASSASIEPARSTMVQEDVSTTIFASRPRDSIKNKTVHAEQLTPNAVLGSQTVPARPAPQVTTSMDLEFAVCGSIIWLTLSANSTISKIVLLLTDLISARSAKAGTPSRATVSEASTTTRNANLSHDYQYLIYMN